MPFLGIPPSQTWQILGPGFPLGDCPLLPAPAIPSSLCRCPPPSTNLAFVPRGRGGGAQLDSGSKVPAAGLSGPAEWGDAEVRPDPRLSSHSAGRAERTQAAAGHWLPRRGPLSGRDSAPEKPRERRCSGQSPSAWCKCRPRSGSAALAAAGSRHPARRGRSLRGPDCWVPARAPRRGSRVRPPAACPPVPTAVPRPARPGPVVAPRPGRDSWAPKGLSRQRSGPSAPRAARPPRAGPSAHAPARYLRSRSRSSSTWPLSPGGRPSARPLGSAPRTLLATRTQPGEEGRGSDYHILAYQRASRGLSSQWSLWKGGDWVEHA